ncbi:MAG: hypothetical protein KatS3mg088_253 [Patescibacteria group bacterium]|nr:MAG: hypothetical protein KatS3mg088_253 [Patescibacteria group bacterium]
MKTITRYLKIWFILNKKTMLLHFSRKFGFFVFLIGKILRFIFFITFLFFILKKTGGLGTYSSEQVILFFVVFNLISIISQMFFRGVYTFRQMVVSGNFDLVLSKPFDPLFRVVFGGFDFIDLVTIPPLVLVLFFVAQAINPSFLDVILFSLLLINSLFISFSIHTLIVSFSIITLEIDHIVMIYRDLETMARFPLEIYGPKIATFLTYFIPLGIMVSFPAKVLMGLLNWRFVLFSFLFAFIFYFVSVKFWNFALRKYTSASS